MFGVMGLTAIPLNVATILSGSIALGIGIDYSIHYLARYRFYYYQGLDIKSALVMALKTTGHAILIILGDKHGFYYTSFWRISACFELWNACNPGNDWLLHWSSDIIANISAFAKTYAKKQKSF